MKSAVRQILADLKAAVLIGDPDALLIVLEHIREMPDADLPPAALGPLGAALAGAPSESLAQWLADSDPAVRGVVSAALGARFARGFTIPYEIIAAAADDPSEEARDALVSQIVEAGAKSAPVVERLLRESDPRPVVTGLRILAHTNADTQSIRTSLAALDSAPDYALRTALVEALSAIAESERPGLSLDLLDEWAAREEPNVWVITRAASSGWALEHSDRIMAMLESLASKVGRIRPVLRAMARHSGA